MSDRESSGERKALPVKQATTIEPIHELLARRWSPRAIDEKRPVTSEELVALLEAARWAPSCFGEEPWRYVVCDRFTDQSAWDDAFACLAEGNQSWAKRAPALLLSVAVRRFSHNGRENRWAAHDTGAASENLCLEGTALGLVVHQMGGFDADEARKRFSLPEEAMPMAMIAVGHPGDPDLLDDKRRERELSPRKRKPFAQLIFAGRWEHPFEPGDDGS